MHRIFTLALLFVVFCDVALGQGTSNISAIGSKNRFYCKANSLGFAQMFRTSPFSEIGMNQRIRAWERKRNNLRAQLPFQGSRQRGMRSKLKEFNRMIRQARSCRRRNAPLAACPIFVDNSTHNQFVALPIINGAECFGFNSPAIKLDIYDWSNDYVGSCTGSVIHSRVILTAAHCVEQPTGNVRIFNLLGQYLGSATTFFQHPSYDGSADHDLAIIRTSFNIESAALPILKANNMVPGEVSAIAGYGLDQNNNVGQLRAGFFSIRTFPFDTIESRFLPGSGSNSCYGDSGGPALVYRNDRWYLAGVVSNGDNRTCGINGQPDLSRWTNITSPVNLDFLKLRAPELFP